MLESTMLESLKSEVRRLRLLLDQMAADQEHTDRDVQHETYVEYDAACERLALFVVDF